MMSQDEACAVLGVTHGAGAEEVRRAYRRLARRCHPDAGGDPATFLRLQQAVEVLLGPRPPAPRPVASPSTSSMTRPSTTTRIGASGWGEASAPRWHDVELDLDGVDWDRPLPPVPHPWTRERVAVAVAREVDGAVVASATGVSRRPGSRLNRLAGWLSTDLLARWWVRPARDRGVAGHDVEVRIELPSGAARRRGDQVTWPLGWTRERRPGATIITHVLTPSPERRATALRAADCLVDGLEVLAWPLADWRRVVPDRD